MSRLSWKDFERLAGEFFAKESGIRLLPQWSVRLKNGLTHKFDFSSEDEHFVVQCKSFTWTRPGNHYPHGKVADAQRAIQMLQESNASRKILAFDDDLNQKGQGFVEVFVRRNKNSLSGVEVWRHRDGKFELFFGSLGKSDQVDSLVVDQATRFLVEASSHSHTLSIIAVSELAKRLQTTPEILRKASSAIASGLKNEGITASFEGANVRFRREFV